MIKKYLLNFLVIVLSYNFHLFAQNPNAGKTMPVWEGDKQSKTSTSNNAGNSNLQEEKVYSFGYSFTQKAQLLTNEQRAQFPDGYTKEKILYISNIVEAIKNSKQFWNPQNDDIPWRGFFSQISKTGTYDDYEKRTFGWSDYQTVNNKRNALISDFQQKGFRVVNITNFYYNQKERITSAEIKQSPQVENRQLQLTAGGTKSAGKETAVSNASSPSKDNDDFWNTPENTTTKQEVREAEAQKRKEEEEQRQEELRAEAREREQALLAPYVLNNVTDRDTVYESSMQLIQSLNPVLQNAIVTISWTNTKTNQSTTLTGINNQVALNEGWNKFNIVVWENNKPLKSSVRLFYDPNNLKKILFTKNERIKLKSYKERLYLHRPDSPRGVTVWSTGALIWSVEVVYKNRIKLKSWKGDFLCREDSQNWVTTCNEGDNESIWTVEVIEGNRIKLRSWKGDYLNLAGGINASNTGSGIEWTVEFVTNY